MSGHRKPKGKPVMKTSLADIYGNDRVLSGDAYVLDIEKEVAWYTGMVVVKVVHQRRDDGWLTTIVAEAGSPRGSTWVCHHWGKTLFDSVYAFAYNMKHGLLSWRESKW